MPILLIEDDESVRNAFKDSLELFGYEVIDAAHGRQALALLQQRPEPIDLVVSDLVMPHMNALELYEALQQVQHGIKMLIVTGYPMPHAGQLLAQQPGVSWTSRPIGIERLERYVRTMIEGEESG